MNNIEKQTLTAEEKQLKLKQKQLDFAKNIMAINSRFAKMQKISMFNPNGTNNTTNSYKKYTREQILGYLKDTKANSEKLIEASNYLYSSSTIYNRICRYLANMLTFDYVLSPYKIKEYNTDKENIEKYNKAYFKTLGELENINIKHTGSNIMQVVVREGAFFGLEISNKDSYMIYQLPYNKCKIYSWEDGCPLFALDMSYFDNNQVLVESIGGEILSLYNAYLKNKKNKWAELDGKYSICITFDETLSYVVPPLTGAFSDIYLIEDYKDLMKSKELINLYKLINLKYPIDDEGNLLMDEGVATTYYNQIASQLDETIAIALNPFDMKEVSFSNDKVDNDGTLKAQRDMFSNLGISSLVFSNEKASSTALLQSLINDMSYVLPCLRSFERWLNKKLKLMSGSIKFQTMFPDICVYNRKDMIDMYKTAATLGLPTKQLYAASMGMSPSQIINMTFCENEMLGLQDLFIPLSSSYTQSAEIGRPVSDNKTESADIADDTNLDRV